MKPIALFPVACPLLALLASCSSTPEEGREREAARTQHYADSKEKTRIRREAREDRIDLWHQGIFADDPDEL